MLILVIAGFCFGAAGHHGSWHNFATDFAGARGGFSGFMIALVAALWAYDGWSDVVTMAGEVERPQRSMPLALVGGVAIVGALYMLTNAAIQYVLPAAAIASADRPAADAMRVVAGQWGATLVSIGMAVSICATFVGSSLSGARVPFAAARDGLFFKQLAHVNRTISNTFERAHPPGRPEHIAAACDRKVSGVVLAGHLQRVALLRAHRQHHLCLPPAVNRNVVRPYSIWGYPVLPALFIVAAAVLLVFSFADQPRNSLVGTVIILLGIPVHYLLQRTSTS